MPHARRANGRNGGFQKRVLAASLTVTNGHVRDDAQKLDAMKATLRLSGGANGARTRNLLRDREAL